MEGSCEVTITSCSPQHYSPPLNVPYSLINCWKIQLLCQIVRGTISSFHALFMLQQWVMTFRWGRGGWLLRIALSLGLVIRQIWIQILPPLLTNGVMWTRKQLPPLSFPFQLRNNTYFRGWRKRVWSTVNAWRPIAIINSCLLGPGGMQ